MLRAARSIAGRQVKPPAWSPNGQCSSLLLATRWIPCGQMQLTYPTDASPSGVSSIHCRELQRKGNPGDIQTGRRTGCTGDESRWSTCRELRRLNDRQACDSVCYAGRSADDEQRRAVTSKSSSWYKVVVPWCRVVVDTAD